MIEHTSTRAMALLAFAAIGFGLVGCSHVEAKDDVAPPTPYPNQAENRGQFGAESCGSADRVAIPANAAYAAYFDSNGTQLSPPEVIAGVQNPKMCPLKAEEKAEGDPGICTPLCSLTMGRKTYCVPC